MNSKRLCLATAILVSVAATRVFGASLDERLSQLERDVQTVRDENRALKQQIERLEKENAAGKAVGLKPAMPEGVADADFRAKVKAVLKDERPAPFIIPAGKETQLKIGGLLQVNSEIGDVDAWLGRLPSAANDGDDRFRIKRARINISGEFKDLFDFKFEGDFANTDGSANRQGIFSATDLFANWRTFPEFQVQAGQFKAPFGMEELTSDSVILTPERSFVTQSLAPSRLVGAQLWGWPLYNVLDAGHEKLVEYRLGAFNGNGRNRGFNDNESFLYAGRLQFNSSKPWNAAYSDHEFSKTNRDVRLSVGVNGLWDESADRTTRLVFQGDGGVLRGGPRVLGDGSLASDVFAFGSDYQRRARGADIAFRYGPFDISAEYIEERFEPDVTTAVDREFKARGFYVMGGWFLPFPNMEKKFQWIEKFEGYDPSDLIGNDELYTLTSGLNWYIKGDDIKLMLEWLHTWSDARHSLGQDDDFDMLLTRLQLMF